MDRYAALEEEFQRSLRNDDHPDNDEPDETSAPVGNVQIVQLDDDDNNHEICTPPDIRANANEARNAVIPSRSERIYKKAYKDFRVWQMKKKTPNLFSENMILGYFKELSEKYCPTTLWSRYSELKKMLRLHHKVDISNFKELVDFVKIESKDYHPRKSRVFTNEEIAQFLDTADDKEWLLHKVCSYLCKIIIPISCTYIKLCRYLGLYTYLTTSYSVLFVGLFSFWNFGWSSQFRVHQFINFRFRNSW